MFQTKVRKYVQCTLCILVGTTGSALYEIRTFWYYLRMDKLSFRQAFIGRLDDPFQLATLFDFLPDAYFYAKTAESQFVHVNASHLKLRGFQRLEQIIGLTDFDIHPDYLAEQYVAEDQRVMKSKVPLPHQVWLVPNHLGELKWYLSSKVPLFGDGGKVIGIAGVLRDFEKVESVVKPYQDMEQVLAFVLRNYADRIDVGALAELLHLSVSQFDRRFKTLFQMTPQQYILTVRINAACRALITTTASVAKIAVQTGFYDQSYFTKQFRKHRGMSPSAYRKRYTTQPTVEPLTTNTDPSANG